AHGCQGWARPHRSTIVRGTSCRSSGIAKGPRRGPQAHDDAPLCAAGRTAGRTRGREFTLWRLALAGVALHDQQTDRYKRDGTARVEKAEVAHFHEAVRQDMLEEPAEKRHDVEVGGAEACTAHFPVGERDGAVREAHETVLGDSDLEDIRSEGGESGGGRGVGPTVGVAGGGASPGGGRLHADRGGPP